MHKRNFSLTSGTCLNDENYSIITFDIKVDAGTGDIYVLLPEPEHLNALIGTDKWMVRRDTANELDGDSSGITIVGPDRKKVGDDQASSSAGCIGECGDSKLQW